MHSSSKFKLKINNGVWIETYTKLTQAGLHSILNQDDSLSIWFHRTVTKLKRNAFKPLIYAFRFLRKLRLVVRKPCNCTRLLQDNVFSCLQTKILRYQIQSVSAILFRLFYFFFSLHFLSNQTEEMIVKLQFSSPSFHPTADTSRFH